MVGDYPRWAEFVSKGEVLGGRCKTVFFPLPGYHSNLFYCRYFLWLLLPLVLISWEVNRRQERVGV